MQDLQEKENYYLSIIQDKEKDIEQLQLQVEIASKSSLEEVNETRLKIEESLRELESHKSKRLAARNEMIHLAKALEKAESEGKEIKTNVQYTIAPIIYEQVLAETNASLLSVNSRLPDQYHGVVIDKCRNGCVSPHISQVEYCYLSLCVKSAFHIFCLFGKLLAWH